MSDVREVVLDIGEFHFGAAGTSIRTLLGSCISIALWHPRRRIGGMCHCLLPLASQVVAQQPGRDVQGAMRLFMAELLRHGTQPSEYMVRMYGGGQMFSISRDRTRYIPSQDIGQRNIEAGRAALRAAGFTLQSEDTGGLGSRRLRFDIGSGQIDVVRGAELRR